jgi:hypothetical protein
MMRLLKWMLPMVAAFGTQIASADVFNITTDNSGGSLCSVATPCGTVTVTGTTTLHVVIALNAPRVVFGNNDAFGFNVVGSTAGLTMSNFSNAGYDGNGGSGNEDGWGTFQFRVDGPPSPSGVSTLSFDVTRTGGFSGPSGIEAGATGANGFTTFAMHVSNGLTGGAALTGYAGVTPGTSTVPEPTSVLLFGSMIGLVCRSAYKRRLQ